MNGEIQTTDKFKLGKKWFWIGIIISFLNMVAGLVYGAALLVEKDHRQEGWIIIAWAIAWFLIGYFFIGPWLIKIGLIPKFQIVR